MNFDVIIAGSGLAGLYAAINLPKNLKILIISKRELILCNSALAQGGVAAVYETDPFEDDISTHREDTLRAGGYKNNPETLDILVSEAGKDIEAIINMGVNFDKNPDGSLHRTLEGGHSKRRIFHHKDATGFEIVSKLLEYVKTLENVEISDNSLLCQLVRTATGFSANILRNGEYIPAHSRFMILATGGIGRVYEYTTNSAVATGDGIAFAYELGAKIRNLSLVQFHPTAFNNRNTRECFLISEAVRGEGAYLINQKGERFMNKYDERLELAPRDVVSHAIIHESRRQGSDEFYLDISHKDSGFLREHFPMIYKNLLEQGFDLTKDAIPIFPCQHYLMGGISVNRHSETDIQGLYAAGECAFTGVHGNNRLASNSLLEALVFSRIAAEDIARKAMEISGELVRHVFTNDTDKPAIPHGFRTEIRHILQQSYFVLPDMESVRRGLPRIKEIYRQLVEGDYLINADYVEAKSLATVAWLILEEVARKWM